jgi:hypothetical protein
MNNPKKLQLQNNIIKLLTSKGKKIPSNLESMNYKQLCKLHTKIQGVPSNQNISKIFETKNQITRLCEYLQINIPNGTESMNQKQLDKIYEQLKQKQKQKQKNKILQLKIREILSKEKLDLPNRFYNLSIDQLIELRKILLMSPVNLFKYETGLSPSNKLNTNKLLESRHTYLKEYLRSFNNTRTRPRTYNYNKSVKNLYSEWNTDTFQQPPVTTKPITNTQQNMNNKIQQELSKQLPNKVLMSRATENNFKKKIILDIEMFQKILGNKNDNDLILMNTNNLLALQKLLKRKINGVDKKQIQADIKEMIKTSLGVNNSLIQNINMDIDNLQLLKLKYELSPESINKKVQNKPQFINTNEKINQYKKSLIIKILRKYLSGVQLNKLSEILNNNITRRQVTEQQLQQENNNNNSRQYNKQQLQLKNTTLKKFYKIFFPAQKSPYQQSILTQTNEF